MNAYRGGARRRGLRFVLEDISGLIWQICTYCGAAPENRITVKNGGRKFTFRYQGIDRVDNSRGYELDNVTPCCRTCNMIKGERSVEFMRERAREIYLRGCQWAF